MDSLEVVEMIMLIEELFGTEIPSNEAERFGSPREIVDWLEFHLSNQRPNENAAALLNKLAKKYDNPELAEGLTGPWRRQQIDAIIRDFFN